MKVNFTFYSVVNYHAMNVTMDIYTSFRYLSFEGYQMATTFTNMKPVFNLVVVTNIPGVLVTLDNLMELQKN